MIRIYCDGSCLHQQSAENREAGAGFVAIEDGEEIAERSSHAGSGADVSNNVAEYEAVRRALQWRDKTHPDEPCTVYTDSRLIVKQVQGTWQCNEPHLATRQATIRGMLGDEDAIEEAHDDRHLDRAHDLAQAGARRSDPPSSSSGRSSRSSSSSRSNTSVSLGSIKPQFRDGVGSPVEQPHPGIEPGNIPDTLKKYEQWVCWSAEIVDGRETKVPRIPGDPRQYSKSNDPDTWGTFEEAVRTVNDDVVGVGFVLVEQDPFVALDYDSCRDRETGEVDVWVLKMLYDLYSFSQISTSGTGVHCFVEADGVPSSWTNRDDGYDRKLEIYGRGRFIAMTGHRINLFPSEIAHAENFEDVVLDVQSEVWE